MSNYVEAGCIKCGQRFNLPLNESGEPIWIHQCPKTTDERIDELTDLVKKLEKQATSSELLTAELAETNRALADEVRATREAATLAQQYAAIDRAKDRRSAEEQEQRDRQEPTK